MRGPVPIDELREYLLLARRETYDQKPIPVLLLPDMYFIRHSSTSFRYRAFLFGGRRAWRSNKVEAVGLGDRLVWHGFTDFGISFKWLPSLQEQFFEFLGTVLHEHPETRLDQAVEERNGKWYYLYDGQGDVDQCWGPEMVFWDDHLIARGFFAGRLHTRY